MNSNNRDHLLITYIGANEMAEPAKSKQQHEEEGDQKKKLKDTAMQFGLLAFTSFLSGIAMAAGAHAYQSAASQIGRRPYKGNVTPIRNIS